jgi:pilus assembly protein CpaB
MRSNTVVMLVIAIIFGSVAVYAANIWLNNQTRPTTAQVQPALNVETSTLVVAAENLSFGTALSATNLKEIPWPKATLPEGSFAKLAELATGPRRVALAAISPNEPILKWKISGPDARASLSAIVTEGMRAVSVRINDVVGVGGFILPGDRVDVLYTRNASSNNDNDTSSTDILIQNARVLGVDQFADQNKSDPVIAKVATIEVTALDAQKVALAHTTGTLSLTLRSAGSLDTAKAQRVVEQELVSSPSAYLTVFDKQAELQAALDQRLQGLEGSLSNVARKVDETNSSKASLSAKLAALEDMVKKTAKSTGQGEDALRKKLLELETAIGTARSAKGQGDDALRAKLASFEADLRKLAAGAGRPVIITPAEDVAAAVVPTTASVGVARGMKREAYVVPIEVE